MKLEIKIEIPDEFIEAYSKYMGTSTEETTNYLKDWMERFLSMVWEPFLEGLILYKNGLISYEEFMAKVIEIGQALGAKANEEIRRRDERK